MRVLASLRLKRLTQGANGELKHVHSGVQVEAEVDVQPVHSAHQVLLSIHHLHPSSEQPPASGPTELFRHDHIRRTIWTSLITCPQGRK